MKHKLLIILIIILCMISVIPDLTLRCAVFFDSPKSAFTIEYERADDHPDDTGYRHMYRIIRNEPIEKTTEGHLYTWAVYHIGPFHYARYYGEA